MRTENKDISNTAAVDQQLSGRHTEVLVITPQHASS
jgi:hypothetical protein